MKWVIIAKMQDVFMPCSTLQYQPPLALTFALAAMSYKEDLVCFRFRLYFLN
jgi:hypothetical protein